MPASPFPRDDVYTIHIGSPWRRLRYVDVLCTAEVYMGTLEQQMHVLAQSICNLIYGGYDDLTNVVLADEHSISEGWSTLLVSVDGGDTTISIPVVLSTRLGVPVVLLHKHTPPAWNRLPSGDAWIEWAQLAKLVVDAEVRPLTEEVPPVITDVEDIELPTTRPDYIEMLDVPFPTEIDAPEDTPIPEAKSEPFTTGDRPVEIDAPKDKHVPEAKLEPPATDDKPSKTSNGILELPDIRVVPIPEGIPSMIAMEDRPLQGSDAIEWNVMGHVIRQYQVLSRPLPLMGGRALEPDGDTVWIAARLLEEYPWMGKAIEEVVRNSHEQLAGGRPWFRMQPTILVGPPGSGKTSFVRSLAALSGLGWNMLDCAATHDAVTIAGTPRGYNTATPNFAAVCMEKTSTGNPIIHLDEIEKATRSHQGYVPDAILGLTEPATASAYYDQCLQRVVDLSACSWIATANDVFMLGSALKSRFRIVHVPAARGEHVEAVIRGVARSLASEWGMDETDLAPIPRQSVDILRRQLDEGSLRTVSRSLRTLWTRDIMENGRGSLQ